MTRLLACCWRLPVLLAVLLALGIDGSIRPCPGQMVYGHVVAKGEWSGLAGASVALLDTAQHVVVEGRADSTGFFLLRAQSGRYMLRVQRSGYVAYMSKVFALDPAQELVLHIALEPATLALVPRQEPHMEAQDHCVPWRGRAC